MDYFCITTLTCNNRFTIFLTISTFIKNTKNITNNNIVWYILLQNYSNHHFNLFTNFIDEIKLISNIKFIITRWEKNNGLSKGTNYLINQSKDYKYVLHLEDDWIHLPYLNTHWLDNTLLLLETHPDISTIVLRKYKNYLEKSKYGWNQFLNYRNFIYPNNFNYQQKMKNSNIILYNHIYYQQIPHFLFSLNPHIRRNQDYFITNTIPLKEYNDINISEQNHNELWGYSEAYSMEKTYYLNSYYLDNGILVHYDDWFSNYNITQLLLYLFQTKQNPLYQILYTIYSKVYNNNVID